MKIITYVIIGAVLIALAWSDNEEGIKSRDEKIKKYGTASIDRIVPFCRNGYSYLLVYAGSHSGIGGVSPEVGPDGFVEC